MTLYNLVEKHLVDKPEEVYFHSPDGPVTYRQFHTIINNMARQWLSHEMDLQTKRLIVNINNPTQLFFIIWTSIYCKLDTFLLPALTDQAYIDSLLEQGDSILLTDIPGLLSRTAKLPLDTLIHEGTIVNQASVGAKATKQSQKEGSFTFLTSGTTSKPKQIKLNHRQFYDAITGLFECRGMNHAFNKNVFIAPPLFHSFGLSAMLEYTFGGSSIMLPTERSFIGPLKRLFEKEVSNLVSAIEGVPYFYSQLAPLLRKNRLNKLVHIGFGGDALSENLLDEMRNELPHVSCSIRYGLTETPSVISVNLARINEIDIKSSGLPLPFYDVKIPAPENGETIGYSEILVAGKCLSESANLTPEGYYATGDLGYVNQLGQLCVSGRLGSMIKNKGFRINPLMVEEVIKSNAAVSDCRVYMAANKLVADLVLYKQGSLVEIEFKKLLRLKLPDYAVPEVFVYPQSIPRTISGKIKRHTNKSET